jgi:predicted RNA-binding Zn-ribbon protein involved in translation (DUF1610 family)
MMVLVRWKTMRCYNSWCNGVFRVKRDAVEVVCPYCGSKNVGSYTKLVKDSMVIK